MEVNKRHKFDFEGNQYEIRVLSDGYNFQVRTFLKGAPANGYIYSVDFPKRLGMKKQLDVDAVEELVRLAEEDIMDKTWERYLKAVSSKQNS